MVILLLMFDVYQKDDEDEWCRVFCVKQRYIFLHASDTFITDCERDFHHSICVMPHPHLAIKRGYVVVGGRNAKAKSIPIFYKRQVRVETVGSYSTIDTTYNCAHT